jgi:beta-lactamase regulating signal transducer with metallopeptidase domain/predicted  nucleic acid-binding Zn-ribbon protein
MDMVFTLGLASLKALLLLTAAAGISLTLRGRPARLRAVVWGTALVGSLLIPAASVVMPTVPVVVPIGMSAPTTSATVPGSTELSHRSQAGSGSIGRVTPNATSIEPSRSSSWRAPDLGITVVALWAAVAFALFGRQGGGHWQMIQIIRRAAPIEDPAVLDRVDDIRTEVGCKPRIRLVASPEIGIPAVFGFLRPTVILPTHFDAWLEDRLTAVLQHELIHVVRFDWPIRVIARLACSVYWFNPLAWWAVRRLNIEQETACDEEVLSLGSRASSYACHLLSIARTAVHRPALAVAGLEMARRSDLEERIMLLLNRTHHRRIGLAVILPAALLTAALVPAIAAVQPTEPERKASPALKSAMAEIRQVEERLDPHIARIEEIEIDMEPIIEEIEALEIEIDHEAIARIEVAMEPYLEKLAEIEIDMAPFHEQMEAIHERFETMTFHINDGTLEEVQHQIREQLEAHRAELENLHISMEPFQEQLEMLHEELEPLHDRIADLTQEQTDRILEQMELNEVVLDRQRAAMEQVHRELEPLHQELESMGARLDAALVSDVAAVLRSHLGPVTAPGTSYDEAAARIIDGGNIHTHDEVLELNASSSEVREILIDLFSSERVGTHEAFDRAIEAATNEASELRIDLQ